MSVSLKSASVLLMTFSAVLSAAPRLGLSTNALATVNVATGANGPSQAVQAFNLGDGTLNLTATTSASWLTATVGAQTACSQPGGVCYPVNIGLNSTPLPGGIFTEYVTVTDPNAVDSPQDIAVTVNTTGVPGAISAYVAPFGTTNGNAMFPIFTKGAGVQSTVTTQSGGNWLQFLNGAGLVAYPAPYLIQVSARPGQAPGAYTGSVTLTGSSVASDNKVINVTLNVTTSPIVDTTEVTPIRLTGFPGGGPVVSAVTLNSVGQGTLAITAGSSAAKFLSATASGSTVTVSADPTGLAPGIYSGTVTITSNAANTAQVAIPVELTVAPAGQPAIPFGAIANAATGAQESVSPGDVVAIYGNQLAPAGTFALNTSVPLAKTLGGTQVLVNGVPAPLYFVAPGQTNFQIPYSLTGQSATVQVISSGGRSNIRTIGITPSVPRLLYFVSFIQGNYGVIVNASDSSLPLPAGTVVPGYVCHPAKPGDTLVIYGIGFGQTNPPAVEGEGASASPLQKLSNVSASFGGGFLGIGQMADAGFAGLTPTAVGLYQINVTIPPLAPLGNSIPVMITADGVQSNTVNLAISANGK
ncbi:MAG: hypothetical protein ABJC09_04100 [Terriglobia bacterium]